MPELPEVESVARSLREGLLGRRLEAIQARWAGSLRPSPATARRALVGLTLLAVDRHGKYLFLTFGDAPAGPPRRQLMLHLRMTGQLFTDPAYRPDKHLRLRFDFDGRRVYYRDIRKFGGFDLLDGLPGRKAIPHVGPDWLALRFREWAPRLDGRRAPIKGLLLDQGVAAGLGNIYADEALFRAGIHPATPAGALDATARRRLFDACRRVLRLGIRHGGTTFLDFVDFDGRPGNFRRKLRVYGRTGEPCRACGTPLVKTQIAGRGSHFCPRCQPPGLAPPPTP
ncbi:MAG: bifunctional DNA-formamidopyrimidine glycosylase/DNA-(apurinic or apyrimidinic site) lyase [Candidatus Latescibacteria bacterium]|nr:bifunctional DNA-formamidopyrimidine glycosylase/DNA-(apurinic or apyrimidinic site) lyase [bacterium]MCB9516524.1 bifunctional DNA-formamidopyrimidine glycosylase/DNA-(apurinic or apyrimidinic site) lyase [Candidatus Latescibacterota bacterium]